MLLSQDIEVMKGKNKYRVSDNPFTLNDLSLVSYDVQGAGYERSFDSVDRINGRFNNATVERAKKVNMVLQYSVDKIAYASHLKSEIQKLFSGEFYLRHLATNDTTIPFQNMLDPLYEFELEYVDGRQIYVGLVSEVSFDTTKTTGNISLEFETLELPYFESIGYSTDLEKSNGLGLWSIATDIPYLREDRKRKYTFENVRSGYVYNLGDIPINQFTQDFVVEIVLGEDTKKFEFVTGRNSEMMIIKNINLKKGDVIKYDGLQTFKNGIAINGKKYGTGNQPSLEVGENVFTFNQFVDKVTFKFKMYFR